MSEETITQEELKRLKQSDQEHKELKKMLESSEEVTIEGTTQPEKPEDSYCGNCNDNGVQTVVTKGQNRCDACGEELEW